MLKGKRYDKNVKLLAYYDPKVISSGLFSEFESYILFKNLENNLTFFLMETISLDLVSFMLIANTLDFVPY